MRATTHAPRSGNRFAKQATPAQRDHARRLATQLFADGLISAGHKTNVFVATAPSRKPSRQEATREITRLERIRAQAAARAQN